MCISNLHFAHRKKAVKSGAEAAFSCDAVNQVLTQLQASQHGHAEVRRRGTAFFFESDMRNKMLQYHVSLLSSVLTAQLELAGAPSILVICSIFLFLREQHAEGSWVDVTVSNFISLVITCNHHES